MSLVKRVAWRLLCLVVSTLQVLSVTVVVLAVGLTVLLIIRWVTT